MRVLVSQSFEVVFLQNSGNFISFSVDEADEERLDEEDGTKKDVITEKKVESGSNNILVVETEFERMPRRSSFRSKERREITR